MRCEEALGYWQQDLLGQPVDRDKLEEAYAHIGACQDLCARTLGAAPDFDLLSSPEERAGQTDLYESLGLSAEEEGDAHARAYARLVRLAKGGRASQEAVDHERAMALAAWQSAATYYHDGLRISETAFLTEGLKRVKKKRLEPAALAPGRAQTGARIHGSRVISQKTPDHPASAEAPAERPQPALSPEIWPTLELISHAAPPSITVGQRPDGWHVGSARLSARLALRENAAPYASSAPDTPRTRRFSLLSQPQLDGTLAPFALALWANELSQQWELELLVRAYSPRRPWASIVLTLEDWDQRWRKPTPMQFARRAPRMVGWWARLKEVATGDYQLRLSASNPRGEAPEDVTLGLHLIEGE